MSRRIPCYNSLGGSAHDGREQLKEPHLSVNTACASRVQTTNEKMEMNAVLSHLFSGDVRTVSSSSARLWNSYT